VVKQAPKESNKDNYQNQKKLKSLNNKLSNIEAKITRLEKEIKEKDVELATNYEQSMAKPDFLKKYQEKKKELEKHMQEWEQVQEELELIS
jgi:ATP-binding cassette subfamily F protein 3